jgi:hypothetical protein
MFSAAQLRIIARLLYIALGYGSRSERIKLLFDCQDAGIQWAVGQLRYSGYLKSEGVDTDPK